ncbi:von Willebrand factor D and EGF domain-containing protein-like [Lineus longissimus]|uniref:von Willebrand factor D and EGF domain-containing protein-like n=1 Tax=Lineus longissimus TaxID=88925 RepID=UPI00315D830F
MTRIRPFFLMVVAGWCVLQGTEVQSQDPCLPGNHQEINQPERSINYTTDPLKVSCDKYMSPGWYRFTSPAGWEMPTECVPQMRCGTMFPIWLQGDTPPRDGQEHDLPACITVGSACCALTFNITVKRCNDFAVYELFPITTCDMGYCAGTEVKCPPGLSSETGYTPCYRAPEIKEIPQLNIIELEDEFQFQCNISSNNNSKIVYEMGYFAENQLLNKEELELEKNHLLLKEPNMNHGGKTILGRTLYCRVRARFHDKPNQFGRWVKSPGYFMGIEIVNNYKNVSLAETDGQQFIYLKSTIPFKCNSLYYNSLSNGQKKRQCKLEVMVENTNSDDRPLRCPNGKKIPQVKFGKCMIELDMDNWNDVHAIPIKATRDFKYDGVRMRQVEFIPIVSNMQNIWNGYKLENYQITAEDFIDQKAYCKSQNDPHMLTFDGHYYNNYLEGEFIFYRHKALPFEVRTFYKKCNGFASCNCAVAARAGDDVIVVDRCNSVQEVTIFNTDRVVKTSVLKTRVVSQDTTFTEGFRLLTLNNGLQYEIYFPHGAFVRMILTNGDKYLEFMNVYMYPSPDDFGQVEGLCGTFDKNVANDLMLRDGTVYTGRGTNRGGQPNDFNTNWRVWANESLYSGQSPQKTPFEQSTYCNCIREKGMGPKGGDDWLQCRFTNDVELCELIGKDITKEKQYQFQQEWQGNARTIEFEFDENFDPMNVTWPTPSGWTEAKAKKFCEDFIKRSAAARACSNLTIDLDLEHDIEMCMEDIKLCDCTDFAMGAIEDIKEKCSAEIRKNVTLWVDVPGLNYTVPPPIPMCINECSFQGECVSDGVCVCDKGWAGIDCSIDATKPPDAYFIPAGGRCDIRKYRCESTPVYGRGFQDISTLSCRFEPYDLETNQPLMFALRETKPAQFENFGEVVCPTPVSRLKRSTAGVANEGFLVSVTNDGKTLSNKVLFVKYDSRCQQCNETGYCTVKPGTCMVENACFMKDDFDPDNECQKCVPSQSTTTWMHIEGCTLNTGLPAWAYGAIGGGAALLLIIAIVLMVKLCSKPSQVAAAPMTKMQQFS